MSDAREMEERLTRMVYRAQGRRASVAVRASAREDKTLGQAALSAVTSIDLDLSPTANATTPPSGRPSAKSLMAFWVRQSLALGFQSMLTWAAGPAHRTTITASPRRWTR